MRKLAILVIASLLATAYAPVDARERAHHKHVASPAKAAAPEPTEKPVTHLPVPVDTFRA